MLNKLNAIEQWAKTPEVKVKAVRIAGGVVNFIATAVIANLVSKTIDAGVNAVVEKITSTTTTTE